MIWITRVPPVEAAAGPLHGLTMALKDNIDLAGVPTTAGDPRNDQPAVANAFVVDRLIEAGAVPLGKTNLDQYATGLVGTRSPYGACHSVFSELHVSGGSSSGSAVAVATGEVDFALGTDTAGSGRVPAAFNGLVGIKPSRGLVSARGVVPACRSLDCVTVMARTVSTARRAFEVMVAFDPDDPWSRRTSDLPVGRSRRASGSPAERSGRAPGLLSGSEPGQCLIGVPDIALDLDPLHEQAWQATLDEAHRLGTVVKVDVSALLETADLLYSGPWLAERWLAFGDKLDDVPEVDPTVRVIVRKGSELTAAETFAGFDRLATLARAVEPLWSTVDALLLPVTETHPTLAEVAADPIGVNSRLGRFTNMVNLLDLCAVAFPGPTRTDGLPFGIQLLAPAGHDELLIDLAAVWCGEPAADTQAAGGRSHSPGAGAAEHLLLAVAGAHLSGQPLNHELTRRGGRLAFEARTAADYRMYLLDGPRPGLSRGPGPGPLPEFGIQVEVWSLPASELAGFMGTVAAPLAIGPVELADGREVLGFVCSGVEPGPDITEYGSWRNYLA